MAGIPSGLRAVVNGYSSLVTTEDGRLTTQNTSDTIGDWLGQEWPGFFAADFVIEFTKSDG
jgi:hypothetical protein